MGDGLAMLQDVGMVRSEIQDLLKVLVNVLKDKLNESKDDLKKHPNLIEAKFHAVEFGGKHMETIFKGIEGLIDDKIETVGHQVEYHILQYTDEIVKIVTDPAVVAAMKKGAKLAKEGMRQAASATKAAAKEGFKVASQEAAMLHETASNLQEMAEKEVVNMQERILKWKQRILNRNVTKCKRILRRKL